jgi:hypothetical protein
MKLHRENRIIPKGSLIKRIEPSSGNVTKGQIYELLENYNPEIQLKHYIEFIADDGRHNDTRYHSDCFELYKLNDVELDNIFII